MLRPGRPFTMVENVQTKTKTQNVISFKDDERFFGFDALNKKARFPKQVINYMNDFIGVSPYDKNVVKLMQDFFLSYDITEDEERAVITFNVDFNGEARKFKTEEIYGMIFRYIKYLADKFAANNIRDCVVTIPAFYGYKEKQALENAIEIAGLHLLSYVNENVAAAVHFFMDKRVNTTQNIIFYNMGSSYTQAALVKFSYETEEVKKGEKIENKRIYVIILLIYRF